jgi:hypothetical protein
MEREGRKNTAQYIKEDIQQQPRPEEPIEVEAVATSR